MHAIVYCTLYALCFFFLFFGSGKGGTRMFVYARAYTNAYGSDIKMCESGRNELRLQDV